MRISRDMRERIFYELEGYLQELQERKMVQSKRLKEIDSNAGVRLKRRHGPKHNWYYYSHRTGDPKLRFLGEDQTHVINEIKEYRYLDKSLSVICKNIEIIESALGKMKSADYESINSMLPDTYRGANLGIKSLGNEKATKWKEGAEAFKSARDVYRPEELKIMTDDGKHVRSKSEAMIYNYLLSIGVTFVYELPMRLNNRIVVPDFTLLSEIDYETEVIIEHQGLMDAEYYRKRFGEKVHSYMNAGFIQGNNIFFTFDNSDGGFDRRPIEMVVKNAIRPNAN